MNVDQNFCGLNTIDGSQRFFGIVLDCRWNIRIIRRQRELHFDFAAVDLNRFHQPE